MISRQTFHLEGLPVITFSIEDVPGGWKIADSYSGNSNVWFTDRKKPNRNDFGVFLLGYIRLFIDKDKKNGEQKFEGKFAELRDELFQLIL